MDLPYALDLAGMLSTRMRSIDRSRLAEEGRLSSHPLPDTTEEDPADMALPLSRCLTGPEWHWLASCAIPIGATDDIDPGMFYRVVESSWAQRAAQRPLPYQHPSKGPYRDVMMPAPKVYPRALQWRAIGDISAIENLLKPLRFVGRRRSVGEGAVLRWEVESVSTKDVYSWSHVDGDTILRPVPEQCVRVLGVGYRMGNYAVRPPSWHPDRLKDLAMTPEREEEW